MLKTTSAPLFFLFTQLVIAVILFLVSHAVGLVQIPLYVDGQLIKGLAANVGLNVIGLRYEHHHHPCDFRLTSSPLASATTPSNMWMPHFTKLPAVCCYRSQLPHPTSSCMRDLRLASLSHAQWLPWASLSVCSWMPYQYLLSGSPLVLSVLPSLPCTPWLSRKAWTSSTVVQCISLGTLTCSVPSS